MKVYSHNLSKFDKNDLWYFVIYMIFLKPGMIDDIPSLDLIWNAARFGLTISFLIIFVSKKKPIKTIIFPIGIFAVVSISTVIHKGTIYPILGRWVPIVGLICWLQIKIKKIDKILRVFYISGSLLIIANFISMIFFPDGFSFAPDVYTTIWILGQKQGFINCFLPTAFLAILCNDKKLISRKSIVISAVCGLLSLAKARPLGLVVCLAIMLFLVILNKVTKRIIRPKRLFVAFLFGEAAAIATAFAYDNLFQLKLFLSNIGGASALDKSITIGIRFQMWIFACNQIIKNPILGVGQLQKEMWFYLSGLSFYHSLVHNLMLDICLQGGLIALCFFLAWQISIVKKLNENWNQNSIRICAIVWFALGVITFFECPYYPMVFMIFALASWLPIQENE